MSKLKVDQISKATGAAPAIFTIPAADGAANQLMKTDGSGQLGWAAVYSDTDGAVTKPLTPAFFAYNDAQIDDATGDNTLYGPIVYGTETFDQGADYNTANGTFTAPVSGRYFLQAAVSTGENVAAHTDGTFELITSNRTVKVYYDPGAMEGSASTGQCTIQCSGVFDMDAADTATTKIRIYGSTKTVDISANNTWFSAVLVA